MFLCSHPCLPASEKCGHGVLTSTNTGKHTCIVTDLVILSIIGSFSPDTPIEMSLSHSTVIQYFHDQMLQLPFISLHDLLWLLFNGELANLSQNNGFDKSDIRYLKYQLGSYNFADPVKMGTWVPISHRTRPLNISVHSSTFPTAILSQLAAL